MPLLESPMLHRLERFLDATSFRHNVIVNNMANADTPGYKTQDVDFRQTLAEMMGGGQPGVMTASFSPSAHSVKGLSERPDGNNVSLEREGLLLAENQLQYRLGIQLLRGNVRQIQSAINEGR